MKKMQELQPKIAALKEKHRDDPQRLQKETMKLYKEQERISQELGDKIGISVSLNNQALILKGRGDLDEAMKLLKEQELICREIGNKAGLALSFGKNTLFF